MSGSDADDYKQDRKAQQKRRADRLPVRQQDIESLAPEYEVRKLTEWHYRVNGMLDLYPIHRRFHNLKTQKRGQYTVALEIVKKQIK